MAENDDKKLNDLLKKVSQKHELATDQIKKSFDNIAKEAKDTFGEFSKAGGFVRDEAKKLAESTKTLSRKDIKDRKKQLDQLKKDVAEQNKLQGDERKAVMKSIDAAQDALKTQMGGIKGNMGRLGKTISSQMTDVTSVVSGWVADSPMLSMGVKFVADHIKEKMEKRTERKAAENKRARDLAHQSVLEKAEVEKEKKQEQIQQTQIEQNNYLSDIKDILMVSLDAEQQARIDQLEIDREAARAAKKAASADIGGISKATLDDGKEGGLMGDLGEAAMGGSIAGFISGKIMEGLKGIKWGKMFGIASLMAGLAWAIKDGFTGMFKAEDWGVSKLSGFVGGFLGGADSGVMGAFKGAGKWALIGAGIGSVVPVIGTVIGGVAGALIGAILGWFGGEKIAKGLDVIGSWFKDVWQKTVELWNEFLADPGTFIKEKLVEPITKWFRETFTWIKETWSEFDKNPVEFIKVNLIQPMKQWFTDKFSWVSDKWDTFMETPIGQWFNKNLIIPIKTWFGKMFTFVSETWDTFMESDIGQWFKTNLFTPVNEFISKIFKFGNSEEGLTKFLEGNPIIKPIMDFFGKAIDFIKGIFDIDFGKMIKQMASKNKIAAKFFEFTGLLGGSGESKSAGGGGTGSTSGGGTGSTSSVQKQNMGNVNKDPGVIETTKSLWNWLTGPKADISEDKGKTVHTKVDVSDADMTNVNWNKLGGKSAVENTILAIWNAAGVPKEKRPTFTSGYRGPDHALSKKNPRSQHIAGEAFDLRTNDLEQPYRSRVIDGLSNAFGTNNNYWSQWETKGVNAKNRTGEHFHIQLNRGLKAAARGALLVGEAGGEAILPLDNPRGIEFVAKSLMAPALSQALVRDLEGTSRQNKMMSMQSGGSPTIINNNTTNSNDSGGGGIPIIPSTLNTRNNENLMSDALR
tara:strand:+ start:3860 stop:6604 length:2745 start_codon:yes stop_codon:yes gene_type:complete